MWSKVSVPMVIARLAGLLIDDSQGELSSDEREAVAHLHQEGLDVVEQCLLEVALLRFVGEAEELEVVGVLDRVTDELGVRLRQRVVEARQGVTLASSKIRRYLGLQDVA
jgi:hypothetical protein